MKERDTVPIPANDRYITPERRIAEEDIEMNERGKMFAELNGFVWQITSFYPHVKSVKTGMLVWRASLRRRKRNGSFEYSQGYIVKEK